MTSLEAFAIIAARDSKEGHSLMDRQIDELSKDDRFQELLADRTVRIKLEPNPIEAIAQLHAVLHLGVLIGLEMSKSEATYDYTRNNRSPAEG